MPGGLTKEQAQARERRATERRMADRRAKREAAERAARGDSLEVQGESKTQGPDLQPGAAGGEVIPAPKVPFWQMSPKWQAGQIAQTSQADKPFHNVESSQSLALEELAAHAVKAATYIGRVATGRAKGEQWRMRAAESVLDRIGATAATIDRQRERAAAADAASLAPLLARLAQAQALAARKASATDAETGQTSGTPTGE
jgi:hypothetical protein